MIKERQAIFLSAVKPKNFGLKSGSVCPIANNKNVSIGMFLGRNPDFKPLLAELGTSDRSSGIRK
jgi:hypothetical protein